MSREEFVEKRNKLLCKYFPEVMTVNCEESVRDSIYEGLLMGYNCGQRDCKENKYDDLFNGCLSIYIYDEKEVDNA